jgi:hypothetical protein
MNDTRFEFRLPERVRRELNELANETGLSPAALARLGVNMVLERRDALPKLPADKELIR